jgi:hypothetical protein
MCPAPGGATIVVEALVGRSIRAGRSCPIASGFKAGQEKAGKERTDWLDAVLDPAGANFLMVTAITHHRFSSPIWGEDEVRKLHAELAEIEMLARQVVVDHRAAGPVR